MERWAGIPTLDLIRRFRAPGLSDHNSLLKRYAKNLNRLTLLEIKDFNALGDT